MIERGEIWSCALQIRIFFFFLPKEKTRPFLLDYIVNMLDVIWRKLVNNFCGSGTLRVFKASQRPPILADLRTTSLWGGRTRHGWFISEATRQRGETLGLGGRCEDVRGMLMGEEQTSADRGS